MLTLVSAGTIGAVMVMTVLPVTVGPPPAAVAVIVAVPAATAVTNPLVFTVATVDADVLHVTVAAKALPNWSLTVAVNWSVAPISMELCAAATVTVVGTGTGVTVIAMFPVTIFAPDVAVAVIVADPAATAVTSPDASTAATLLAELDHVTVAEIELPD